MLLTLLDFKHPGIDDLLSDLQEVQKYTNACNILTRIKTCPHEELRGEIGSVSVLLAMLAEYLRCDAQSASAGTMSYFCSFMLKIKAMPLYGLTMFELLLFKEMIESIENLSVHINALN